MKVGHDDHHAQSHQWIFSSSPPFPVGSDWLTDTEGDTDQQIDYSHSTIMPTSSSQSVDVFGIIKTVTGSISELVGYILSRRGIIDHKSKNTLNKINVSFFTPALMFSKVAFSLTSEKLVELYVVPLSFVTISLASFVVGWIVSAIFGLAKPERNFVLSFSMFMNSNSLPIALMTSLIHSLRGQNGLAWGEDDTKDKQLGRSLSYLVLFSTLGLILRWSYGVRLLSSASEGNENDDDDDDHSTVAGESEAGTEEQDASSNSSLRQIEVPPQLCLPKSTQLPPSGDLGPHSKMPKNSLSFAIPSLPSTSKAWKPPIGPFTPHPNRFKDGGLFDQWESSDQSDRQSEQTPNNPPHRTNEEHQFQDGYLVHRPIFHSFPNLKAYWDKSVASSRNSLVDDSETEAGTVGDDREQNEDLNEHGRRESRRGKNAIADGLSLRHGLLHKRVVEVKNRVGKLVKKFIVRPLRRIQQFMTPPLYAAVLSLLVVCLPTLQNWLAEIQPLRSALKSAGNVSVPLTLVVLGAYFNTESKPKQRDTQNERIVHGRRASNRRVEDRQAKLTIAASILSRQILTPLILIPLLFITLRYFHQMGAQPIQVPESVIRPKGQQKFHEDPCFILVMVLLIGSPSAITLAQMNCANPFPVGSSRFIKQNKLNMKFERLVSKTLFLEYLVFSPICSIGLVVLGLVIEANR